MTSPDVPGPPRPDYVFGLPLAITGAEAARLRTTLSQLWELTYGEPPGQVDHDLAQCRDFFDPTVRGYKLRERIGGLPEVPIAVYEAAFKMPEAIVTDAGGGCLIVGVEGRLVLDLLGDGYRRQEAGHWVLPPAAARLAENRALEVYRSWSVRKLNEVIALRTGRGREVLQATSVGIVLALLVNRADSPQRAVMRPVDGGGKNPVDGGGNHPIDEALHSAAVAFADSITPSRGRPAEEASRARSMDEQRLHGGYFLSEARRRLAEKICGYPESVYVRPGMSSDVISFLGTDLARRENLSADQLSQAFSRLVDVFRDKARQLAAHNAIFERPADTRTLRGQLLASFTAARVQSGRLS